MVQTPANLAPHHGQQPSRRNRGKAGERRGIPYIPGRASTFSHFLSHFVVPNACIFADSPHSQKSSAIHAPCPSHNPHDALHRRRLLRAQYRALYSHFAHVSTTFRHVVPQGTPPVYLVEDEEIDFDEVIKEEKIVLLKSR